MYNCFNLTYVYSRLGELCGNITVPWYQSSKAWYFAEVTGTKAHSWKDAYNRCARIKNGNAFPAIVWNETDVVNYLTSLYRDLNLKSGQAMLTFECFLGRFHSRRNLQQFQLSRGVGSRGPKYGGLIFKDDNFFIFWRTNQETTKNFKV